MFANLSDHTKLSCNTFHRKYAKDIIDTSIDFHLQSGMGLMNLLVEGNVSDKPFSRWTFISPVIPPKGQGHGWGYC